MIKQAVRIVQEAIPSFLAVSMIHTSAVAQQSPTVPSQVLTRPVPPPTTDFRREEALIRLNQSMDGSQDSFVPDRDTARSMGNYGIVVKTARCLAGHGRREVLRGIGATPGSVEESRRFARTYEVIDTCGPQLTAILSLQRGSFSEAIYLKQHLKPVSGTASPDEVTGFVEAEKAWNAARDPGDQTVIEATNCLVASNPGIADAILRSGHGSEQEAALMDELFAKAPRCAGASRPATLSRTFLRAFIADSLYRAADGENRLGLLSP